MNHFPLNSNKAPFSVLPHDWHLNSPVRLNAGAEVCVFSPLVLRFPAIRFSPRWMLGREVSVYHAQEDFIFSGKPWIWWKVRRIVSGLCSNPHFWNLCLSLTLPPKCYLHYWTSEARFSVVLRHLNSVPFLAYCCIVCFSPSKRHKQHRVIVCTGMQIADFAALV